MRYICFVFAYSNAGAVAFEPLRQASIAPDGSTDNKKSDYNMDS